MQLDGVQIALDAYKFLRDYEIKQQTPSAQLISERYANMDKHYMRDNLEEMLNSAKEDKILFRDISGFYGNAEDYAICLIDAIERRLKSNGLHLVSLSQAEQK